MFGRCWGSKVMLNLFAEFARLIPSAPLQIGTVIVYDAGMATVELIGGGLIKARGDATVGQHVFVRDGVIEGNPPALSVELIDV